MTAAQPLYLLADSQLLFWKRQDRPLLDASLDGLARDTPVSAAYIGASNGDRPEFYGIFEAGGGWDRLPRRPHSAALWPPRPRTGVAKLPDQEVPRRPGGGAVFPAPPPAAYSIRRAARGTPPNDESIM